MRTSALLFGTSLAYLISAAAATAAVTAERSTAAPSGSGTKFVIAPYTAGPQELFTSSIVNVNTASAVASALPPLSGNNTGSVPQGGLNVRQGGLGVATIGLSIERGFSGGSIQSSGFDASTSSAGFSSANNTSGTSSAGFSSANNTSGTSSVGFSSANNSFGRSSVGFSSANNTSGTSSAGSSNTSAGARTVLVLSSLVNSTDPRVGSAGAVFQGIANTPVNTVSFRYGSVAAAAGQATATSAVSPVLVIDDQSNGSAFKARYIPVSSGTVSANNGLTTVTFNANQLLVAGQVQRIGVAIYQRGTVAIDNIIVNGVPSSGILAQAQQSFPF